MISGNGHGHFDSCGGSSNNAILNGPGDGQHWVTESFLRDAARTPSGNLIQGTVVSGNERNGILFLEGSGKPDP